MVPWGATLKEHQVFLSESVKACPSCGSQAPAHDTQLRELKHHLGQAVWMCKGLSPSIDNPMYKAQWDKLWKTLMMARIAVATLKSSESTYTGQISAYDVSDRDFGLYKSSSAPFRLGAELPRRKTWCTHQFKNTALIYHFNPKTPKK